MDLLFVLSWVIPAACFSIVCFGFWRNFVQTGKWTSLLWIAPEGLVILLLVFRRESRRLSGTRGTGSWPSVVPSAFCSSALRRW
jgi:hypothetical protein